MINSNFPIFSNTLRHSLITLTGTILNGILGLLFYISLARYLGPNDFGLITISITILTLIADIADFGTNSGLVRFVSKNLIINKREALKFLKLGLEIKLAIWIAILLVSFLVVPFLANTIFKKPELNFPLHLTMLGVGGALLFTFATSALQAFQKFLQWSFINILTNFLRLAIIFGLIIFICSSKNG